MNPFWNVRFDVVAQQAAESKLASMNTEMTVQELVWKVNKLTLVNRALLELLEEKFGLTEAELMAKMSEIDLQDGHMNGRAPAPEPISCEACGKTYSKRHNHCLYCGHVNTSGSPL